MRMRNWNSEMDGRMRTELLSNLVENKWELLCNETERSWSGLGGYDGCWEKPPGIPELWRKITVKRLRSRPTARKTWFTQEWRNGVHRCRWSWTFIEIFLSRKQHVSFTQNSLAALPWHGIQTFLGIFPCCCEYSVTLFVIYVRICLTITLGLTFWTPH